MVVGGETLVLRVRAEDGLPYASRVRPMRLFIASVSRNADPVILDAAHFRSLQPGARQSPGDLVAAIPIEPVEDEARLFVLATRDPGLAIGGVEAALRGLVQSKLYAFDETRPSAIRDLATVPDINIPAPRSEDYIVLATARKAAPFLDGVKAALASSQGARRDLGPEFALRQRLVGAARGIGANIEAVPASMIARKATTEAAVKPPQARDDPLMETCLYALTPSP